MDDVIQENSGYEDAMLAKLQHFDDIITTHKANTNIAATASQNQTPPEVKLPSLSLPTFSGTEDESWDNFWNKFVDSVDSNANVAKTTKFTYLQSVLKDEALQVVCNLTFTDDGYDNAMQLLKDNYDKAERTIRLLTQKLLDINPPNNTADSLQAFRLELEFLLMALKNKVNLDESDWIIQVHIKWKIPSDVLDKFFVLYNKSSLTVKDISEELRSIIKRQRDNPDGKATSKPSSTTNSKQQSTNSTPNKSKTTSPSPKWKQGSVGTYAVGPSKPTVNASPKLVTPQDAVIVWKLYVFCEQPHSIYYCKVYPDCATRIKRLKELSKCTKCIRAHNPDTCTTQIRTCNRCHKGQHHTALCEDSSTKSAKPQEEEGTTTSIQLCTVLPDISVFSTRSDHKSALPTAQLIIKNGKSKATVRGLFDQGSQMTFMSKELVDALKLTPVRETRIDIAGFLTNSGARVFRVVQPKVRLGGYVRKIQALVVDRFPTDLYVYGLGTTAKFLEEKGINLADKITTDNLSNIGILMGSDVYHTFIKGKEEKQALLLGVRLAHYLIKALSHIHFEETVVWSDNEAVLQWVKNNNSKNPYMSNRIKEIRELSAGAQTDTFGTEFDNVPKKLHHDQGLWLDTDNYIIIRSEGRLQHADIDREAKNPILLPRHHIVSKLIV
ncbi:uncharacterized protein [Procambarus clarkii]|uniref:uncharacterized protein n=1 Tax=Procambarus clarkii TaxID=6728 RepID=UPI003743F720